ncbi:hypothetical protein H9Q69_003196 [Fusarium xylarioides]|nr:hypothetical protein H9Q69_003196 [Fusarium xylarioides]
MPPRPHELDEYLSQALKRFSKLQQSQITSFAHKISQIHEESHQNGDDDDVEAVTPHSHVGSPLVAESGSSARCGRVGEELERLATQVNNNSSGGYCEPIMNTTLIERPRAGIATESPKPSPPGTLRVGRLTISTVPLPSASNAFVSFKSFHEVKPSEVLASEVWQRTRESCNPQQQPDADNDTSDEESAGGASGRGRGLQASLQAKAPGSNKRKDITSGSEEGQSNEELELKACSCCTQDCLLGLKRNQFLDEKCLNVELHRSVTRSLLHPINAACLLDLLCEDLAPLVYRLRSIRPLDGHGKYRRTGVLFKISRYGYTFVGKGTFAAAIGSLEHERKVYERMEPLGSIALDTPFPLAAASIVHMLLMAWAGDVVTIEGQRFQQLLSTCGVIHDNVRPEHLLWNSKRGHLLLIDFDLATILPDMHHTLQKRLSKTRKRHLRNPVPVVGLPAGPVSAATPVPW